MASEDLDTATLDAMYHSADVQCLWPDSWRLLIAEIRRRRAADLTDEEREALRWLRKNAPQVNGSGGHGMSDHVLRLDALDVLDKLLGGGR